MTRPHPVPGARQRTGGWLDDRRGALTGAVLGFLACGTVALPVLGGGGPVLGIVACAGALYGYRRGGGADRGRRWRGRLHG